MLFVEFVIEVAPLGIKGPHNIDHIPAIVALISVQFRTIFQQPDPFASEEVHDEGVAGGGAGNEHGVEG